VPTFLIAIRAPVDDAGQPGAVLMHVARAPSEVEAIDLVAAYAPAGYAAPTSLGLAPAKLVEELNLPPGEAAVVQALG
jgi:hypothetical protein